eukprot:TRINITY_DN2461_c0_g1_i1.p1 TRINITY_DN2461_c0_g1~~TRINITY_DN2461_c0_g1_i1.p1  ORF type:complete len:255 (+),score=51.45 TRINITY_DN2461_c0_g1_i1:427-1191(+)
MAAAAHLARSLCSLNSSSCLLRRENLKSTACSEFLPGYSQVLERPSILTRRNAQFNRRCRLPLVAAVDSDAASGSKTVVSENPTPSASSIEGISSAENNLAQGSDDVIVKELSKAVKKTASTFAPRASTKQKNPAVPGSALYRVFEVQGYASMAVGGLLSFNLIFPSNEPDIWRLMGMWSVWMFTIPSLRARDCSSKEKDALNYLFLVVPLVNIILPIFWKSFAAVWTADVITFVLFYAWKMEWLQQEGGSTGN